MAQSTYNALSFIKSFPPEEQSIAQDLYFTFEGIKIWQWSSVVLPFFCGVLAIAIITAISPDFRGDNIAIGFVIFFGLLAGILSYKFMKRFADKICSKNIEQIRAHLRGNDIAQSAFGRLRAEYYDIDCVAEKHHL